MPGPLQIQLDRTKDPKEFECMCRDVLSDCYGKRFEKYGTDGQPQHGIDICVNDFSIVGQCKNYFVTNITDTGKAATRFLNKVKDDYNEAMTYPKFNNPKKFIAMTSLDYDIKIQNEIPNIGDKDIIEVWFWGRIAESICFNDALKRKYTLGSNINNCISAKKINNIINDLHNLQEYAKIFHDSYINWTDSDFEDRIIAVHDNCIKMFKAALELDDKIKKVFVQLNRYNKLGDYIRAIVLSLPNINKDKYNKILERLIGINEMKDTIHAYLLHYQNDDEYDKFISNCQNAIDEIQKVPSD